MLMIKVFCWIAGISALLWVTMRLVKYCNDVACPYEPFTRGVFVVIVAAYLMLLGGVHWYSSAAQGGGDVLNGFVLAIAGGGLLAWIIIRHVRATSLRVGLGISVVQLPLFAILAYCGLFVLILGFAFAVVMPAVFGAISTRTVRISDW